MFGKKKTPDTWSGEDIHMKELLDSMCEHKRVMRTYCREIVLRKGSAEMLPDGPDKNVELQEIETYQKHILNLIAAYDVARKAYNQIDASKLVHYNGKAEWCNSHEMLRIAWKTAFRKVAGM